MTRRILDDSGTSAPLQRVQLSRDGSMAARVLQPVAQMQGLPTYPIKRFIIGVWVPTNTAFSTWKQRGINTFFGIPDGANGTSWIAEANAYGMMQIRHPRTDIDLRSDAASPYLLAWMHPDEPDLGGQVVHSPADLAATRAEWYAAAPHVPVMLNFSGGDVNNARSTTVRERVYRGWLNTCDWVAQDLYPVTGWGQPTWHDHRYAKPTVNQAVNNVLRELLDEERTPNKPLINFIECCDQRLNWVPAGSNPTPQQQSAHVWDAIINGALGICYFTIAFNPFSFDNMTPEQVAQMESDNALIVSLEPWLLGDREYIPLTTPFQRAVFTNPSSGTTKTLTINQSNAAATLDTVEYGPYELIVT